MRGTYFSKEDFACLLFIVPNPDMAMCETYIDVYKYITQNIRISKHEKHLTTSQFRYETFYYVLSLKVLPHKGREAQSFYSGFFICTPNTCGTHHKGLREQATTNRLPPRQVSSQLTDFFKISQILRTLPVRDALTILRFHISAIVTSLSDTSVLLAHA